MNEQTAASRQVQDREEWMSALFDGELESGQAQSALDRLGRDGDLARQWSEYARIGDLMRGDDAVSARLEARIRAALAAEPTILAPLPEKTQRELPRYWLAAAAAVAAISWGVFSAMPAMEDAAPVADSGPAAAPAVAERDVTPYMIAHQDYAYAVVSAPEMQFTPVAVAGPGE